MKKKILHGKRIGRNKMDTTEKLNRLSELQATIEANREYYNGIKAELVPPEIKAILDKIDVEFNDKQMMLGKEIDEITKEIKYDVINLGKTVPGKFLMAVYNKARVTWDNHGLEGFMVAHPEIVAFRKEGEPTVTIRKSGKGE
jgi:hypothetical protein